MSTHSNDQPKPIDGANPSPSTPNKNVRLSHEFDIPQTLWMESNDGSVIIGLGFVELKKGEELLAAKRSRSEAYRLANELAMESLRYVTRLKDPKNFQSGGERTEVSTNNGTADVLWNNMHPKVRSLAIAAYGELHQPNQGEAQSFLKSRKVSVG